LRSLGVPQTAYDVIVTSGDVTLALLQERDGQRVHHIGPERDQGLFAGLNLPRVAPGDAQFILCSGLFDDTRETPETYRSTLVDLVRRRVPMVCANPDLRVERGGTIVPCAGAVAALYESLGGEVAYAGKPYAPIYALARAIVAEARGTAPNAQDILCIGDGLNTDIKGAHDRGIDVLYIASAVDLEAGFSAETLAALFKPTPYRPIGAQAHLTW
jgi:HAD superfamily hydrolase (TIGR01459 family)